MVVATELPQDVAQIDVVERVILPQVAARLAAVQAKKAAGLVGLTAIVPVHLPWKQHLAAHKACHAAALVWNEAVNWLHGQWREKKSPGKEDLRRFVTAVPNDLRPFHAHTAQAVAYDLYDAVATMRENNKAGRKARAPWREKKYRPLSFTRDFGRRSRPRDNWRCRSAAAASGSCCPCRRSSPATGYPSRRRGGVRSACAGASPRAAGRCPSATARLRGRCRLRWRAVRR